MNNFSYSNNLNSINYKKKSIKRYSANFKKIFEDINIEIDDEQKTLNVINNKYKFNFNINEIKKFNRFKSISLIGMGGSILGSKAIFNFLRKKIKKKFDFFDNIDEVQIEKFKKNKNLNKTLFLVISKSGNTIETLSNLLSLNIIKKNAKNIIIISEKKDNILYSLSKKFGLFFIEHNNSIGGRYSVLSEVGIIPAYFMGIDIVKLRSNLKSFLIGKNKTYLKDSSIRLSYLLSGGKINNLIFLNYLPELENFLYWCQQLISESLGKKRKGFLPLISSAPKDHHSLLQLYLDGPKNKLFHIFSYGSKNQKNTKLKKLSSFKTNLDNNSLSSIRLAQKNALIKVFKKKKIPFREFKIKSINEETLGQLFTYFILETIFVGKLVKINPFDQPAVEQVKIYTKKLLNQKTKYNF